MREADSALNVILNKGIVKMKIRRRIYITNAGMQFKYSFLFAFISLLGTIAAITVFNFYALKELEALKWSTHIKVTAIGEVIDHLFIAVGIADLIIVTVMLIIAGVFMVKKTSGPIYRMEKDILKFADGDLSTHIILRRKDEFKDTAFELDTMISYIRERFGGIIEKYPEISKSIEILDVVSNDREQTNKYCDSILEQISDIEAELNGFSC
jgi:methyl-accepting chemotaxis protein